MNLFHIVSNLLGTDHLLPTPQNANNNSKHYCWLLKSCTTWQEVNLGLLDPSILPQDEKPQHQRSRHHQLRMLNPIKLYRLVTRDSHSSRKFPVRFCPSALGFESWQLRRSEKMVNVRVPYRAENSKVLRVSSESIWVKYLIGHVDLTCSVSYLIDTLPGFHIILGWGQQWSFCISPTLVISARTFFLKS